MSIKTLDLDCGQNISLMPRAGWEAHLHRRLLHLKTPVTHIRFTSTETSSCQDTESCVKLIKMIQETHMDSGFDDIPHK